MPHCIPDKRKAARPPPDVNTQMGHGLDSSHEINAGFHMWRKMAAKRPILAMFWQGGLYMWDRNSIWIECGGFRPTQLTWVSTNEAHPALVWDRWSSPTLDDPCCSTWYGNEGAKREEKESRKKKGKKNQWKKEFGRQTVLEG